MSAIPDEPTRIVIDCDPGIDDATAIALALASPELELLGVTTVAGNVPVDETTRNALRLLQALGRPDVPVAAGAERGLVRAHGRHPPIHGANGLGGVELPPAREVARAEHAVEFLAALLREAPAGSIVLAAIGPLTNVALLVARHPDLAARLAGVVAMGGSAGRGNCTPVAEFNVWADPEAAHRVLAESDVAVRLVGLDVTRRAVVTEDDLALLETASARARLLAQMVRGYADRPPGGWPLHDALAVASLIDPTLLTLHPAAVDVDTGPGVGRAQTVYAFDRLPGEPAPVAERPQRRVDVALDVDAARFRSLLLTRLADL